MLLFYCADESELPALRREGLPAGAALWTSLDLAQEDCSGCVLVVDPLRFDPALFDARGDVVEVDGVPPEAVRNLEPYRPAGPVAAGGGYVVRPGPAGPELLLIFRRGVWDLPKGKQDADESITACALREVREEVGIRELALIRELGTTVHGYERGGAYHVKTTYWYLLRTPETDFTPQAEEEIEKVAWMPWPEAVEAIGYEILRRHMQRVERTVRLTLGL